MTDCPYCNANAEQVSDSYNDGGYRNCDNGHTFHIDDWSDIDGESNTDNQPPIGIDHPTVVPTNYNE